MGAILVIIGIGALMCGIETINPGRLWPKVPGWYGRALFLNFAQFLIVCTASRAWNVWFAKLPLIRIEQYVGAVTAGFIGYFLITFIFYWWHRARHEINFLWVRLHQIHHSAQRLEVLTAFYKNPLEILCNSMMMSIVLYCFLGMSPIAAGITTLLTGLGELFYHWNVKTPYWVGFIFQRPESHCIHHKRGWHTQNYSDLPIWDMLFGTFHNPKSFEKLCGFKDNRESRLLEMLLGRDVNPSTKGNS